MRTPVTPNKTDAGNGSYGICRVIGASRSPSPDPKRSQKISLAAEFCPEQPAIVPEIFRHHGYRFFFFSPEAEEPIRVHVESAEKYAKFWLDPIFLAESHRFLSKQLKQIRELIENHEQEIRNKWDEHVTTHRQSQN